MEVKFVIPGDPVGKQRIRVNYKTKVEYTPSKTISYEKYVGHCYYGNHYFGDSPVGMSITIYKKIPTSVSKKKRELMLQHKILPTKKPDLSNILKSIEDGLNGIAYKDDKQIAHIKDIVEFYDDVPRVEVTLWEI